MKLTETIIETADKNYFVGYILHSFVRNLKKTYDGNIAVTNPTKRSYLYVMSDGENERFLVARILTRFHLLLHKSNFRREDSPLIACLEFSSTETKLVLWTFWVMDYLKCGQFRNFGQRNELIKSQFLTHQLLLIVNKKQTTSWEKGHFFSIYSKMTCYCTRAFLYTAINS